MPWAFGRHFASGFFKDAVSATFEACLDCSSPHVIRPPAYNPSYITNYDPSCRHASHAV
jgi:hypothetical protein